MYVDVGIYIHGCIYGMLIYYDVDIWLYDSSEIYSTHARAAL